MAMKWRNLLAAALLAILGATPALAQKQIDTWKSSTYSASFTRPANTTQYSGGAIVCDNTTLCNPVSFTVVRYYGEGNIVSLMLHKNSTSTTSAFFRVHLYNTTPTVTVGDNGTIGPMWADRSSKIAWFDCAVPQYSTGGDSVEYECLGSKPIIPFKTLEGSQKIYAIVQTMSSATYTPASGEQFDIEIGVWQEGNQ